MDSALLLQTADKEIIVVDDASTDGSQRILSGYGDAIHFIHIETNHGKGAARNYGAALATGDFLVFLDGDDAFLPWASEVLERVVQAKTPKLILCDMLWFKGTLPPTLPADAPRTIEIVEYRDYMKKDRPFGVSASSLVIDRQSFESVQGWARERFVMQDQDLVFRLGDAGRTIQILSPPTTLHRAHAGQTVNQVRPFIDVLYELIRKESLGQYAGGHHRRFERSALFGGLVFFWAKRAFKVGLYWEAVKLLTRGWPMVLAAIVRRSSILAKGRRPVETIDM